MRLIKRLDTFILKAFLQLLAATFFICLFVYMMQYTWRYIDELIGKGLSLDVLGKFFGYMALTFVPFALPPAVLLAALITFGNMGEQLELLSMKAAGIPLLRILRPLVVCVVLTCGCSFYFQNRIGPEATKQLASLIWSMKQASPELDIPEGTFYSEIPGYNIFVEQKDMDSGILHGVMIYSNAAGDDTQIVLADSGRLQSTADKKHLMLTLWNGERFRNMDSRSANMMKAQVPYMRETFSHEVDLIAFDANFNVLDASLFANNASTKDLTHIRQGIDSLVQRIDSMGRLLYDTQLRGPMQRTAPGEAARRDSLRQVALAKTDVPPFDTLYAALSTEHLQSTIRTATSKVRQLKAEYDFRQLITNEDNRMLRLHYLEAHRKFTLSLACLMFFFIGAPLGAIIRKGGLGMPVIISVSIFIFYYIINASGEKMAKSGAWYIPFGAWLSTMVLTPIGIFLTYKANKDSAVFNTDGYRLFFMRLLGLRESRKLNRKEVIIHDPDYATLPTRLQALQTDCQDYVEQHHLMRIPNYRSIFFEYEEDTAVIDIDKRLEALVDELHNSRDMTILNALNSLPVLVPDAHTRPFSHGANGASPQTDRRNRRRNIATGLFLSLGLFFFLRIWRYRVRLRHDMSVIQTQCQRIIERIEKMETLKD